MKVIMGPRPMKILLARRGDSYVCNIRLHLRKVFLCVSAVNPKFLRLKADSQPQ